LKHETTNPNDAVRFIKAQHFLETVPKSSQGGGEKIRTKN